MISVRAIPCLLTLLICHSNSYAAERISRHESNPEDIQAITQITKDFQQAIINKDVKLLSGLMLNSKIPFESPSSPEMVKMVRDKFDVNFDGTNSDSYGSFAQYLKSEKAKLSENFQNINITQDGHIAWVMFDYEFLKDNIPQNYGIETWQMLKTAEGKWKITSVIWSTHLPNKANTEMDKKAVKKP